MALEISRVKLEGYPRSRIMKLEDKLDTYRPALQIPDPIAPCNTVGCCVSDIIKLTLRERLSGNKI